MEIITVFCPEGFMGVAHNAANSTAPSPLFLNLLFLNFCIATPLLCLPHLCGSAHIQRSLAGLRSSSLPSPPTKSILRTIWHSYPSSHSHSRMSALACGCYRAETFEREVKVGDKEKRGWKTGNGRQKLGGIFSVPFTFPEHTPSFSSPPSPLLGSSGTAKSATKFILGSTYTLPPTLSPFSETVFNCWTEKRRIERAVLFLPCPLGAQNRNTGTVAYFLSF